jgi:hypothetical protein
VRLIVATHPAPSVPHKIGKKRDGVIYELFVTQLAAPAFSAKDVLDLYLHRGSFETVLADEDREQDPDRWCSHTPCGQEFWQIVNQWLWNIRLELGQHLSATPMRTILGQLMVNIYRHSDLSDHSACPDKVVNVIN